MKRRCAVSVLAGVLAMSVVAFLDRAQGGENRSHADGQVRASGCCD